MRKKPTRPDLTNKQQMIDWLLLVYPEFKSEILSASFTQLRDTIKAVTE